MNKNCVYCYKPLDDAGNDFHEHCSLEFFGTKTPPQLPYSLDQMAELAKNEVQRSVTVPGVQPKLSLSVVKGTMGDKNTGRLTIVGAMGGNYIFKPPSEHYPEMPQVEHVTMRIAGSYGIPTVKSSLIRLQSGELSYITKRIDRTGKGKKIHMLDMFQILEAFDKYKSSMERIGKALGEHSGNTLLDQVYFFELTVFCFLTGNNDMHLKNFSMIDNGDGWSLSPAYDLLNVTIINPNDTEELALTLEGKKKKLKREHFERMATGLGLSRRQTDNVFARLFRNRPLAEEWLASSFLSNDLKEKYLAVLAERYDRLAPASFPPQ
jgi:serine/threonine-protein kinase HipA